MSRTILLLGLLAACSSGPVVPPGTGRGLVDFDTTPPAGAQTWNRPTWQVGDKISLVRGGVWKVAFEVTGIDDKGYVITDEKGNRMRRDLDLGQLGDFNAKGDEMRTLAPVDVRFHWPLWVGKHWRCSFVEKTPDHEFPASVTYVVEAVDTITVPAGTYQALRILRTLHLDLDGPDKFLDHTHVIWYAPEIGQEVRQVINDSLIELVERGHK